MTRTLLLALFLACSAVHAESVPLVREHGTFVVPVLINDKITLNFTIDSGASDVTIPADVFSTLIRTGTVFQTDLLDKQEYELADGSLHASQRFRIRSLRIGGLEIRDVVAAVAPEAGSLLLGQSFLSRIQSWSIDNERHLLLLNQPPTAAATTPPAAIIQPRTAVRKYTDVLLKAVAFALAGDDTTHVEAGTDCTFQIPVFAATLTFHLNNVDPARIRFERPNLHSQTRVQIFGERVVVDRDGEASDETMIGGRYYDGGLTHYTTFIIVAHTTEYQRMLRAWRYIYAHGCDGMKSSF
ncbi:MAG: TIGR02281 family clan AA aspartic protease [Steroidobacterales bacterium]